MTPSEYAQRERFLLPATADELAAVQRAGPSGVRPGDVTAVRTLGSVPAWWIRLGGALQDKPNLSNHIAVPDHFDAHGTLWAIEGRPGGVGWADCSAYLKSPWALTNAAQPKTDEQRVIVCRVMKALLGTAYDWEAIVADGAADLGIHIPKDLWKPDWTGAVPGHVVCSSSAAYAYTVAGLACPAGARGAQPADWDEFILTRAWAA